MGSHYSVGQHSSYSAGKGLSCSAEEHQSSSVGVVGSNCSGGEEGLSCSAEEHQSSSVGVVGSNCFGGEEGLSCSVGKGVVDCIQAGCC